MRHLIHVGCVVALMVTSATTLLAGDTMAEIKERMVQRLPVIVKLKQAKDVGEGNRGYLVVMKSADLDKKLQKAVDEENADRAEVYRQIAIKTDVTPEKVGERRAIQIAKESAAGIMIQDEEGEWHEKRKE